ncbi:MAG TPA: phosphoribosylglycinamide formyltransferase [Candidatus Limnocylindrales bacterium]|nr:phosphoribosylglycinamide formyltransferase [Candidatus Limnocylindrales bacterium]
MTSRIAVLASGGGSNLQAILDYHERLGDPRAGDVVLVVSDREESGALERAERRGIANVVHATSKKPDAVPLNELLDQHSVDMVVLAGYLRLVPVDIVAKYRGRLINIHPALLPAFGGAGMYGLRVHRAVIEAGVRVTGVTVHFVDDAYDRGRIIAQWPVPVFDSDDPGTLAARVLRVEHLVYPRVIHAVVSGRTTMETSVTAGIDAIVDVRPSFTLLPHEDSRLAENIELALGC